MERMNYIKKAFDEDINTKPYSKFTGLNMFRYDQK